MAFLVFLAAAAGTWIVPANLWFVSPHRLHDVVSTRAGRRGGPPPNAGGGATGSPSPDRPPKAETGSEPGWFIVSGAARRAAGRGTGAVSSLATGRSRKR